MNKELELLTKEYVEKVNEVCLFMLKGLKLNSKEEVYRFRVQNQMGQFYLDGINKYMFHGIGCEFSNKNIKIDWDFGYDDRWCSIDPWKFYYYIKENHKEISKYYDLKLITAEYDEAANNGEMIKRYDRYYFK